MSEETPERRGGSYLPPHARSQNSNNWRQKDDTPRVENPQQYRRGPQYPPGGADLVSPTQPNFEAPTGTRLYVGNLLYTASRDDVENLFTANGFNLTGISMSIDPFTNRNPSYAFVDFETAEEASRAMDSINGQELLGREVKVNPGVRRQPGQAGERRVKNFASGTPQREFTQRKCHVQPRYEHD
jgi:RNA recognition motif-containing protein